MHFAKFKPAQKELLHPALAGRQHSGSRPPPLGLICDPVDCLTGGGRSHALRPRQHLDSCGGNFLHLRRKLFTLRDRPCCRGGGAAATGAILPAPGSRAGGAKRGAKTMRPPPFVPSARKTRRFAKLSPPEPGAGFANGAFCKVRAIPRPPPRRPCSTTLALSGRSDIRAAAALSCYMGLYLVGQISERRLLYRPQPPPHTTKDAVAHLQSCVKGSGAKRPAASGALDTALQMCSALLVWCVGGARVIV